MLERRTDDTMSHEESDFEPGAFPDRQPVEFFADGGRNAVELRNSQDQPSSGRIEVGREDIRSTRVKGTVTMIDSACDEGVHERASTGTPSLTTGEPFLTSQMKVADLAELVHLALHE